MQLQKRPKPVIIRLVKNMFILPSDFAYHGQYKRKEGVANGIQQPAYFEITVDFHAFRKQGMAERENRIMQADIFLIHDHKRHKIQQQSCIVVKMFF